MEDLRASVASKFHYLFKGEPTCIFSPGRINLIGEHVDYNDGFVFPAAIDRGIVGIFAKAESTSRVVALDLEEEFEFSSNNMPRQDPGSWKNYIVGVIEEIRKTGRAIPNFEMAFAGNIPAGAGLSSSAAIENCTAFGLNELFKLGLTRHELILISQKAEHNYVGVKCGIMDQFASMFGQKGKALLLDCRTLEYIPYEINLDSAELILINTNVKHSLADSAYNKRRAVCEKVSKRLGVKALRDAKMKDLEKIKDVLPLEEYRMASFVIQEIQRVQNASQCLKNGNLTGLGTLLFESHVGLSEQYKVSCEELDFLVQTAKNDPSVLGARMMGGGFGGCTINLVSRSGSKSFLQEIKASYLKYFGTECSIYRVNVDQGTRICEHFPKIGDQ